MSYRHRYCTYTYYYPLADPLGSLLTDSSRTVTTSYGVNIILDNKDSPGQESIFALQPTVWLHDAIITWWCGYCCTRFEVISNYSITKQASSNRQQARPHGKKKTFFAKPHFGSYVKNGQQQGVNETDGHPS
jgi:hypothetical protein